MKMMAKKYGKMVALKLQAQKENEASAIKSINYMLESDKLISVKELTKLTGLSRSYFYKNEKVSATLKKAIAKQKGSRDLFSKNEAFNIAAAKQNDVLENQLKRMREKYAALKAENQYLRDLLEENGYNITE